MDRTLTIRASVHDVQFTLMLSISLVVMVIFLFLRSVWATIIPSITVPVALICTFAVMYLLNYSLDNLSLMALTIAVGFVVDDAIVMLENIYRHIEEGMKPMEAALKGAGEIGFTIVSISFSLIAVFIPLLLMGGIVGRLFREFAMTVTIAVVVSCVVSLTLTPMMCSRFLRHDTGRHGRVYRIVEGFFDGADRRLSAHARHGAAAPVHHAADVPRHASSLTVVLYIIIPKGFFPPQDTGVVLGVTEGAQDVSFKEMSRIQQALDDIVAQDPDVQAYGATVGAGIGGQTENNGRMYHRAEAVGSAGRRHGAGVHHPASARSCRRCRVARCSCRRHRTSGSADGCTKTEFQYTLQDADLAELYQWSPKILEQAAGRCRCCATSPPTSRWRA